MTNGFDELAGEILTAGLAYADVPDVPSFGTSTLKPLSVVTTTASVNWPTVSVSENVFDQALANGSLEGGEVPYVNCIHPAGAAASSALMHG